jgi:hypothetical protein
LHHRLCRAGHSLITSEVIEPIRAIANM